MTNENCPYLEIYNDSIIIFNCPSDKAYLVTDNIKSDTRVVNWDILNEDNTVSTNILYGSDVYCYVFDNDEEIIEDISGAINDGYTSISNLMKDYGDGNISYLGTFDNMILYDTINCQGGDSGVSWTIGNKEVKSLTINNKIVKSIERISDGEIIYGVPTGQKLKFTQDEYTATDGECSITCQLIDYDNNDVANKTITLTGEDGSNYTETTDSNGECIFTLFGKGNIQYTANYNDIERKCNVFGLNNKIKIYVTCSRSTSKYSNSNYYQDKLTYVFKYATKSSNYTTKFALTPQYINGILPVRIEYDKKTTSSGAFKKQSKTVNLGAGTSTNQNISAQYSWMDTSSKHCLQCQSPHISQAGTSGMWWKFEIST